MEVREAGTERWCDISSRDADVDLPVVDMDRWGRAWAPGTLAEYVRVVQRTTWRTGQPAIWRGQSSAWPLHSGAVRRFIDSPIFAPVRSDPAGLEGYVASYEQELIEHARLDGHGDAFGRRRSDLEVLALLQHHGAATRLLDFTFNAFIALWFACRDHFGDHGVVVGIDLAAAIQIRSQHQLDQVIAIHQEPGVRWWRPWGLSPRMPTQAAVFAWSEVRLASWGSFGFGPDAGAPARAAHETPEPSEVAPGLTAIAVSPALKDDLLDRWETIFGYSERRLFPDLDGFARFNGATRHFEPGFWTPEAFDG